MKNYVGRELSLIKDQLEILANHEEFVEGRS